MKLLELFKGTGSVGKVAKDLGYDQIISLDLEPKYKPDILTDIMDWDYTVYPPHYFDVIWASPPCTYYSVMQHVIVCTKAKKGIDWDLEGKRKESDKIVRRVLDIIDYYQPKYWFMENPQSGALKTRDVVKGLSWVDGDYCKYGYPYRKRTRFWTNSCPELLLCKHDCPFSEGNRHIVSLGHRSTETIAVYKDANLLCKEHGFKYNRDMRYSIPPGLIRNLLPKKQVNRIKISCRKK